MDTSNRWYRPRALKKMTIEMPATSPFIYPKAPSDFTPWDKEMQERAQKAREEEQKAMGPMGPRLPKQDGKTLREQAEELLRGRKAWRPGWMDWDLGGKPKGEVGAGVGL